MTNKTHIGPHLENSTIGSATNSFNTVNKTRNEPIDRKELDTRLAALNQLVEQLIKQMPKEQAERASRDLKSLNDEVKSPEPRQPWYEISASGLLDAAKAVASMTAPVTTAVKAVLELLAG